MLWLLLAGVGETSSGQVIIARTCRLLLVFKVVFILESKSVEGWLLSISAYGQPITLSWFTSIESSGISLAIMLIAGKTCFSSACRFSLTATILTLVRVGCLTTVGCNVGLGLFALFTAFQIATKHLKMPSHAHAQLSSYFSLGHPVFSSRSDRICRLQFAALEIPKGQP